MEVNCRFRRGLEARRPKIRAICSFSAFGRFEASSRDMLHTDQEPACLHKREMLLIRCQIINNEMVFLIGNAVMVTMRRWVYLKEL